MAGESELREIRLEGEDGSSAAIRTQGATLTSWKTADGQERIFVSSTAKYERGAAIRGGVPVCWPQFAMRGPLRQQHGFARNSTWQVARQDKASVVLTLDETTATLAEGWTAPFALEMEVSLGEDTLTQELRVRNTDPKQSLSFTTALHTYFTVSDLPSVEISGLQGLRYDDNARNGAIVTEQGDRVRIEGEVDRLYEAVPGALELRHGGGGVRLLRHALPDVVVWNPAEDKASRLADLSDWRGFVCVEAAHAAGVPVELAPGASWVGRQEMSKL